MDSSNSQPEADSIPNEEDDKHPLWRYVVKVEKSNKGGGNYRWRCKFCNEERQGTYTRVRAHLLRLKEKGIKICGKVIAVQIREMLKLEVESTTRSNMTAPKNVSLPCFGATMSNIRSLGGIGGRTSAFPCPSAALKKRKTDKSISEAFDMQHRDQLDCEIARMFYTGGLSFNLARNPYYLSSYVFAADHKLAGYVSPGYNRLRTSLLQQEKNHVEFLLEPIKSTWPDKGVTIVSDGWSDPQRRPLINFMVVSEGGPMFIKAVNCAAEVKDKVFISNLLKEVIDEVGHEKVVQVMTDNAANCKAAGEITEGMYPHIYWTPCVVHTLNLALKNICDAKNVESNQETYVECHWITEVYNSVMQIKNFIMNHNMRLSMFTKFTPLKLLSVSDTRFASVVIMLKRFKLIRRALESMVMSDQWSLYKDDDPVKAKFVRDTVVDDDWWGKLTYIVEFTSLIYDMIRVCDTDKPCLHLVYEMWDSMIEKVRKVIYQHEGKTEIDDSDFYDVVHQILNSRWAKSNTPLHCLAHFLNPRFYSTTWLQEDPTRVPPHKDAEVSTERTKCFRRLFLDVSVYRKVVAEYTQFSLKTGPLADSVTISMMDAEDPKLWWVNFGASIPLLQGLAFKLLEQPASSSCSERNWSTYSFIHSMKRSRLTPMCAEELVFVHNNL